MDSRGRLLLIASGAALATVSGVMFLRWLKHRRSHGGHHHHHGHGGGGGMFDDVNVWLAMHYSSPDQYSAIPPPFKVALDYTSRLANLCKEQKNEGVLSRAMDIGCNVGRVTFELAASFDEVIGVDVSEPALRIANQLRKEGEAPYTMKIEGDIVREYKAVINPEIDRSRVRFIMADACDLPDGIGKFGLIVLSLTLHHLPDPLEFLQDVGNLIVPSGILVIAETYTWHEMMDLSKDRWISGYTKANGEEVRGPEGLKTFLSPMFELVQEEEMSAMVMFKERMNTLALPHVTVWIRKKN